MYRQNLKETIKKLLVRSGGEIRSRKFKILGQIGRELKKCFKLSYNDILYAPHNYYSLHQKK